MSRSRKLVEREVRADDPELSPEANELLTHELRQAVGRDRTAVPADRAEDLGRVAASGQPTFVGVLGANRMLLAITFAVLLVVGIIVALVTDSWWAVVAACAIHAVGTMIVIAVALRLSTEVEHMAPEAAARLEEEGLADPDRALSDLVEQYAPDDQARGAAEVVSSGHNRTSVRPEDDAQQAGLEQRSAMTPAGSPVEPSDPRSAPALLPIAAVAGSLLIGVGGAIVLGGVAWVAAAVMVAVSLAWLLLQLRIDGRGEAEGGGGGGPQRRIGDARAGRRSRLLPAIAIVVPVVVAGVVLVGLIAGLL